MIKGCPALKRFCCKSPRRPPNIVPISQSSIMPIVLHQTIWHWSVSFLQEMNIKISWETQVTKNHACAQVNVLYRSDWRGSQPTFLWLTPFDNLQFRWSCTYTALALFLDHLHCIAPTFVISYSADGLFNHISTLGSSVKDWPKSLKKEQFRSFSHR